MERKTSQCRSCLAHNPDEYHYCVRCGAPLPAPSSPGYEATQRSPDNSIGYEQTIDLPTTPIPQPIVLPQPADTLARPIAVEAEESLESLETPPAPFEKIDWKDIKTDFVFTADSIVFSGSRFLPERGVVSKSSMGSTPQTLQPPTLQSSQEKDGEADTPHFPVGTTLSGRYRIKQYLAQGGFGSIYLIVDIEDFFEDEIILKVPVKSEDPDLLSRRLKSQYKEWKILSEKEPDHVVRLLGVKRLEVRGQIIVGVLMEYMAGGNLLRMVQQKWGGYTRNQEQLICLMNLFLQVCRAVSSLHSNKLLHRDIKPANMLLDVTESKCKVSDFELIAHLDKNTPTQEIMGTIPYMAPECFEGRYSVASDIYSLSATLYQLLSGKYPFGSAPLKAMHPAEISMAGAFTTGGSTLDSHSRQRKQKPQDLMELNPLVSPELNQIIMRCLDPNPDQRPASVDDLIQDLMRLGIASEGANTAPVNLARLLMTYLSDDDKEHLIKSLERSGFQSAREISAHKQEDLLEEYCYTAPPHEVLAHNCTARQLAILAGAVGLNPQAAATREELVDDILAAVGFLLGPRQIPGIESTRSFVEDLLLNVGNATTTDECVGMVHAGITAVERTIDLLVKFYGQLLYGSGFNAFLTRLANGKPPNRLTLGQKVSAFREVCSKPPTLPLAERIKQVFHWPIVGPEIFERLKQLVDYRNQLMHQTEFKNFHAAQRFGRHTLTIAVDITTRLASNNYLPRVVQITSRQDDVYGRHFYLGQDDRGRSERIFTPLPLNVGELYLFFPLTNPARINPLIFPYDTAKR